MTGEFNDNDDSDEIDDGTCTVDISTAVTSCLILSKLTNECIWYNQYVSIYTVKNVMNVYIVKWT